MEALIELESLEEEQRLFGARDRWRKVLCGRFPVELVSRNGAVKILGEEDAVTEVKGLLDRALIAVRKGQGDTALERIFADGAAPPADPTRVLTSGIRPRSAGQRRYVESLAANIITVVRGPAGTGKTFLAVASAVAALRRGDHRKLVLARPAVEAGERLGFLPGDLQAKVNPYLRPLFDALFALMDPNQARRYLETDVIEVVPLAYMRGRTLERSFIILDEAQNTTPQQMKMFLTRMGEGSRVVVTGDGTQTDLPAGETSGLNHCIAILEKVPDIGVVELEKSDIVRHPLVQRIVKAYEEDEERNPGPVNGGARKRGRS